MSLFDTHCHYNLDPLHQNWRSHWQTAQKRSVIGSIVVGTSVKTSLAALHISEQQDDLYTAVGIHPGHWNESQMANSNSDSTSDMQIDTMFETEMRLLTELLREKNVLTQKNESTNKNLIESTDSTTRPKETIGTIVAIGETGLDYFRNPSQKMKSIQKKSLITQLNLAKQYKLPVILHVRDQHIPESKTQNNAYWDTLEIVKEYRSLTFILHCISGPLAYLQEMLFLNTYVGVAANYTYPSAHHIRNLVAQVPQSQLLLETDAPYLPPQSMRGQTCEPYMITHTFESLKQNIGISDQVLLQNTARCFPLVKSLQYLIQ